MLILKLNNEAEDVKRKRAFFRRKKESVKESEFNRYSINVNGKTVLVLELKENELACEDVKTLLKIYKGKVLVSKEHKNNQHLKGYLFEPGEYYKRAVLSSLKNQIRTVNRDWKFISVKINDFSPFKELYEIVKISKRVNLITQKNAQTIKFANDCYNQYGSIISINGEAFAGNEIFLDLDKTDSNGKLMISVKDKDFLLYADNNYFQAEEEFKKLVPFNLEHNIICAAFSKK